MTLTSNVLPAWDMTGLNIATDPEGLARASSELDASIDALAALLDARQAGTGTGMPQGVADVIAVEQMLGAVNATYGFAMELEGIVGGLAAADATDVVAQRAAGKMRGQRGRLDALEKRFNGWTTTLDVDDLSKHSSLIAAHAFPLRKRQLLARHQMSPDAEEVAAELGSVGGRAWSQLRDNLEASIVGHVEIDGVMRDVSIGEFLELLSQPDRDLRRRAHAAQQAAYQQVAMPLAAVVNAVKGETLLLSERRGWDDPLEPMLAQNGIDQQTLDALLDAVRAAQPLYQRYLRALARALGLPQLALFDIMAPVGSERALDFTEMTSFITSRFANASPTLGFVAERAFRDRWLDIAPRQGKVDGAVCYWIGQGQSRILVNYVPSYLGMSTMAHELGHAYHFALLTERQRTWLQISPPPMTLVETASTFCEVLVQHAARRDATPDQELAILNGWLLAATESVFGPLTMYDVEQAIFAARRDHELSVEELNEISVSKRASIAGDALAPFDTSTIWSIWHLGQSEIWHYTFPYIFGLLFGLGLYGEFQRDPASFFARFEDLLVDVSLADANTLASRFGIDLRAPDFWQSSLSLLEADIARFETLVASQQ